MKKKYPKWIVQRHTDYWIARAAFSKADEDIGIIIVSRVVKAFKSKGAVLKAIESLRTAEIKEQP